MSATAAAATPAKPTSPALIPVPSPVTKPAPGPAVTPSTGRVCSVCKVKFDKGLFSKGQWETNAHSRKCKSCVNKFQQQLANQPIIAPVQPTLVIKGKPGSKVKPGTKAPPPASTTSKPLLTSKQAASQLAAARAATLAAAKSQPVKKSKRVKLTGAAVDLLVDDEKTGDTWFFPRAEAVLGEIFDTFDEDRDKAWSVEETQKFALATNGIKFTQEELTEIKDNLHHDDKGNWTLRGFLDFYHLQTSSHPDETWKDIMKLGYDDQLVKTGIAYELKTNQLPSAAVAEYKAKQAGGDPTATSEEKK